MSDEKEILNRDSHGEKYELAPETPENVSREYTEDSITVLEGLTLSVKDPQCISVM